MVVFILELVLVICNPITVIMGPQTLLCPFKHEHLDWAIYLKRVFE